MAGSIGQIQKSYVSSVSFLDKREILNKILDITNEESSFLDVMEYSGRSVVTTMPQYHNFVNDELYVVATATAVTGSPGTTITAEIDATAYAFVNEGELVLFDDGFVGYINDKAGSNQIVIESVDSNALTLAAADKISFPSNAAGEGSGSPDSKRWSPTKYFNQVQTFKGKFKITDIQKVSQVEVEFKGKPYYMMKGQHESLMKFRNDISAGLFFSRISDSQYGDTSPELVDADGNAVQTTGGLDQWVKTYGNDWDLLTAGEVNLADVEAWTQILNADRAPQDYLLWVGTTMNIAFDNFLNALGNSGIISQAARFTVQGGQELNLGIDSFKIYGRTYHKKYLPLLDHKNIVNFTGGYADAADAAYFCPNSKIKTIDGDMVDRLRVRYMAGDGTDLKYVETLTGRFAPVPTDERSVLEVHYQSTQGLEVLGANHFAKIK